MLKLYWAPNTISIAVAITLNEGGVHYENVRIDFASGEQTKAAFRSLNPKGRVPALATPEGILTEAGAILEYLAATAVPGLVPNDPLHAARMREVMYYIASTMHPNHAHKMRSARWADSESSWADMRAKVPETMSASCEYFEEILQLPFLFGDHLTLADPYFYVVTCWLKGDGVEIGNFPRIAAFKAAMEQRPAVQCAWSEGMLKG